jgi:hypothetical protein
MKEKESQKFPDELINVPVVWSGSSPISSKNIVIYEGGILW